MISLYSFDKLALKEFSRNAQENISIDFLYAFLKKMIIPYIVLYGISFSLLLVFSYDLKIESVYFLLIVPFASCIELIAYILRARGVLMTSQFIQFGLFSIIFVISLIFTDNYLLVFFLSIVIALILSIGIFYLHERNNILWRNGGVPKHFKQTSYSFNTFTTISILVVMLIGGADVMIYKIFYSDYIHDYVALKRIAGLLGLPLVINNNHFVVEIVEWFNKDNKKLKEVYSRNRSSSFKLAVGIFGILIIGFISAKNIWAFELDFIEITIMLVLLMLGMLYNNYVGGVNNLLMLCNKENVLMKNNLLALSICLVIYSVLIYYFMIWGLVISNILLLFFINYLNYSSCKKYIINDSI